VNYVSNEPPLEKQISLKDSDIAKIEGKNGGLDLSNSKNFARNIAKKEAKEIDEVNETIRKNC